MMTDEKQEVMVAGKQRELFCDTQEPAPLVIYHAVPGEENRLWVTCKGMNCPQVSLAVINLV